MFVKPVPDAGDDQTQPGTELPKVIVAEPEDEPTDPSAFVIQSPEKESDQFEPLFKAYVLRVLIKKGLPEQEQNVVVQEAVHAYNKAKEMKEIAGDDRELLEVANAQLIQKEQKLPREVRGALSVFLLGNEDNFFTYLTTNQS